MAALLTTLTTLTAGCIANGDTVVMPCGGTLEVARWEMGPRQGEVSVFAYNGERYILDTDCEVGIYGLAAARRAA